MPHTIDMTFPDSTVVLAGKQAQVPGQECEKVKRVEGRDWMCVGKDIEFTAGPPVRAEDITGEQDNKTAICYAPRSGDQACVLGQARTANFGGTRHLLLPGARLPSGERFMYVLSDSAAQEGDEPFLNRVLCQLLPYEIVASREPNFCRIAVPKCVYLWSGGFVASCWLSEGKFLPKVNDGDKFVTTVPFPSDPQLDRGNPEDSKLKKTKKKKSKKGADPMEIEVKPEPAPGYAELADGADVLRVETRRQEAEPGKEVSVVVLYGGEAKVLTVESSATPEEVTKKAAQMFGAERKGLCLRHSLVPLSRLATEEKELMVHSSPQTAGRVLQPGSAYCLSSRSLVVRVAVELSLLDTEGMSIANRSAAGPQLFTYLRIDSLYTKKDLLREAHAVFFHPSSDFCFPTPYTPPPSFFSITGPEPSEAEEGALYALHLSTSDRPRPEDTPLSALRLVLDDDDVMSEVQLPCSTKDDVSRALQHALGIRSWDEVVLRNGSVPEEPGPVFSFSRCPVVRVVSCVGGTPHEEVLVLSGTHATSTLDQLHTVLSQKLKQHVRELGSSISKWLVTVQNTGQVLQPSDPILSLSTHLNPVVLVLEINADGSSHAE